MPDYTDLPNNSDQPAVHIPRTLIVDSVRYNNSAAQFWPTFLDEIRQRHAAADRVVLSAHGDGPLHPRMLIPEQALAESMQRIDPSLDFNAAMQGIAAELEAVGPPPAVTVTVYREDDVIESDAVTEFLDSDIFPFLLVWLLEWCQFSESAWNRALLKGEFEGDDPLNGLHYRFRFTLRSRHLSEGLFKRCLDLRWRRLPIKREATAR